ncbi:GNAT family N-acetyltransferase [Streptomyces sp. N2-109]|uniref:GNAT family N-acetyltransferase n=1 Tax=Streptomyces gossypii TaxID=2883101 RepID=A0ABT2JN21_9ACTN|nr:GNAT family N-acetyltransferase [Streptomyces gossypii]MCT2589277.1 GNAT family N-acetyltransferase [Streptomyces gossypii]
MTSPASAALPIRRLTPGDLPACLELAEDRGWEPEDHKWRLLLTAGRGYGVDAPDRPGGLIGTYVLTSYSGGGGVHGGGVHGGAYGCLSMVLVAGRCARQGLGRRLVRHALDESGPAATFLAATEEGRPLYEQLGFKSVAHTTVLRGTFTGELPPSPPSAPSPPRAPARVRGATAADLRGVIALDSEAFGADRTELLARLPAFADRFVVAERTGGSGGSDGTGTGRVLTGFAACWPSPSATVIGPVVAEDLSTAQALITELGTRTTGPVRYDADSRHGALEEWLHGNGLAEDLVFSLMTHTAPDLPGDLGRRFAPYSVALG